MRRRILITFAALITISALVMGSLAGYTWWRLATIETFDDQIIATPSPSADELIQLPEKSAVFLLFSVGSEGLDAEDGTRLGIGRGRAKMADGLTDSIMVMITDPSSRKIGVISIPRDTWLEQRGHRVNESFNRYGVNGLIADVTELTGLRIDHAMSVNFAAFADLTDAVGGVDIEINQPVRDLKAKLDLPAGCVHLDGANALAFVRSRHWQVLSNGSWRSDSTSSDWGRIERQQSFLRLVLGRILTPELPLRVPALVDVAGNNLTIDAGLTVSEMLSWAKAFAGGVEDLAAATIPGRGFTTDGGASVIGVDPAAVRQTVERVLARIGSPVQVTTTVDPSSAGATASPLPEPSMTMVTPTRTPVLTSPPEVSGGRITPKLITPSTNPAPKISATNPNGFPSAGADEHGNSSSSPKTASTPWTPDAGEGQGGLRFTACS